MADQQPYSMQAAFHLLSVAAPPPSEPCVADTADPFARLATCYLTALAKRDEQALRDILTPDARIVQTCDPLPFGAGSASPEQVELRLAENARDLVKLMSGQAYDPCDLTVTKVSRHSATGASVWTSHAIFNTGENEGPGFWDFLFVTISHDETTPRICHLNQIRHRKDPLIALDL